nr:hypothetical protein [Fusobacterium necrophorum]
MAEKLNNFSEKSSYIYIITSFSLLSVLAIYIRIFLLNYTVLNFINLGIGIFACFLVIIKIKGKETTALNNKSILLILIAILTYNIIFGMIGFPILPFVPYSLGNLLLYTLISYVCFIYFYMKNNKKYSKLFLKIFIILSILDLILPFVLLLRGENV